MKLELDEEEEQQAKEFTQEKIYDSIIEENEREKIFDKWIEDRQIL